MPLSLAEAQRLTDFAAFCCCPSFPTILAAHKLHTPVLRDRELARMRQAFDRWPLSVSHSKQASTYLFITLSTEK
jgi:hypothetical protein